MTDRARPRKSRGPLISSREILTNERLAEADMLVTREHMFANAVYEVSLDLLKRVGYQEKITITIEPLKKEHPQSPGYEIAAKMRRP